MKKNVTKTREIDFGSSYGGFELSGVNCIIHKHKADIKPYKVTLSVLY